MKDGERHTKVAWLLKYLGTCCCERGLLLPRVGCRGEGGVGGGGGGGEVWPSYQAVFAQCMWKLQLPRFSQAASIFENRVTWWTN